MSAESSSADVCGWPLGLHTVSMLCGSVRGHDGDHIAVGTAKDPVIAAAEERGRRSGVEERDELLGRARDWLEFMAAHPGEGDAKNLIAIIDAALAPRDSGKETE